MRQLKACEGGCAEHRGTVRFVTVRDPSSGKDWGLWSYCEAAIAEDQRRGFDVHELKLDGVVELQQSDDNQ